MTAEQAVFGWVTLNLHVTAQLMNASDTYKYVVETKYLMTFSFYATAKMSVGACGQRLTTKLLHTHPQVT